MGAPAHARGRRRRLRRLATVLLWWSFPFLALSAVGGYVAAAIAWHVNPPVVPVEGHSMLPVLRTGDLVLLHGVQPDQIRLHEIIAVAVPQQDQQKYGLPAEVVHRVISISRVHGQLIFQTKGDSNPGPDVFATPGANVIGRYAGTIPDVGYLVLFVRSRQGLIFLGVALLLGIAYVLLGMFDRRRSEDPTPLVLEALIGETGRLRQAIAETAPSRGPPDAGLPARDTGAESAGPSKVTVLLPASEAPRLPSGEDTYLLRRLVDTVADSNHRSLQMEKELADLRAAVGEYALHLQSHTAAVRDLARSAAELRDAVADIRLLARRAATEQRASADTDEPAEPTAAAPAAEAPADPTPLPPAGWYPDFTGEPQYRYWDGRAWTGNVC
ncbi:MAG: signal peptidase I [Actinomycetota bacterium]|nr:signal peptidase I [Actinomycetota bacterium]